MENREWLDEYPTLKQVSTTNAFTVPAGYFNELGERITSAIKLDELKNAVPADGFTIPLNYFEELSSNIQSRINIELPAENTGFAVPENYFEELSNNIKSRIAIEETVLNSEATFTVPENYFDELSDKIQSRLLVEQALNNAEHTFTVPQDYFAGLNKNILNKTVNQDIVKRKGAVIRMISSTAFKYATAACILLTIGAGIFFRPFNNTSLSHDNTYLHKEISTLGADDIQGYLEQNVDANDAQHTVSAEGIKVNDVNLNDALQEYSDDILNNTSK